MSLGGLLSKRGKKHFDDYSLKSIRREMIQLALILATMANASESISCLDNIISVYLGKNILLSTEKEYLPQYNLINSLKGKSIILYSDKKPDIKQFHHDYDTIILGIKNARDLSKIFNGKHAGKIVIATDDAHSYLARHIISITWELTRSIDVIVLTMDNATVQVYSWFPYKEKECDEVKEVILMDVWRNGSFLYHKNLFPEKIKNNLNGCPLHLSTQPIVPYVFNPTASGEYQDGYEILVMNELIREFNMSVKMIQQTDPNMFWNTNRENRGAFHQLLTHEVDVLFGGLMARADRHRQTQAIYPFKMEQLLWMYPKPAFEMHFSSIYTVFGSHLWLAIISFHAFITITLYYTVKSMHFYERHYSGYLSCFFNGISILCNMNTPSPKNWYLRMMVFSYVIYALHLSTAYQTFLIVLLTHYQRKDPYHDIYGLADSELSVYLFSSVRHLYNDSDYSAWKKILQPTRVKYFEKTNITWIIDDIALNRSSFLLYPKSPLDFITSKMYPDDGKSLFEYINHFTYPLAMYVSPGNPLEPPFSKHVQTLFETGIFQYWEKETMASVGNNAEGQYEMTGHEPNFPEALCMQHLEGAFLLLGLSLTISFVAFIGELFVHYLSKKRAN